MASLTLLERLWQQSFVTPGYLDRLRERSAPSLDGNGQPSLFEELFHTFCEMHGGDPQHGVPLVTAWQLSRHAARLLDDIEDGHLSPGAEGFETQLNMSTGFLFSVGLVLNELEACGVAEAVATEIRGMFYNVLLQICGGQHLDLTLKVPTLQESWQIAEAKSGSFTGLLCWAAARLGTAQAQRLELCREFGHNLGMMDQIKDDISDLWGTETQSGDLQRGHNWGLPAAYALSVLPEAQCDQLLHALREASCTETSCTEASSREVEAAAEREARARQMIIDSGAAVYLAVQSEIYYRRNLDIVESLGPSPPARKTLLTVVDNLKLSVNREILS
jgi:geranylgeranyl pyrophosphate synthase